MYIMSLINHTIMYSITSNSRENGASNDYIVPLNNALLVFKRKFSHRSI